MLERQHLRFDVEKQCLCLVDWKTTQSVPPSVGAMKEAGLLNYLDQLGGYSLGLRHLTDVKPLERRL